MEVFIFAGIFAIACIGWIATWIVSYNRLTEFEEKLRVANDNYNCIDRMCDRLKESCDKHYKENLELKKMISLVDKSSIKISVDSDDMMKFLDETKQKIGELIIIELLTTK